MAALVATLAYRQATLPGGCDVAQRKLGDFHQRPSMPRAEASARLAVVRPKLELGLKALLAGLPLRPTGAAILKV